MRIKKINIKNIGTFKDATINFIDEKDNIKKPPITIITGDNGTGKTLILDAIRVLLLQSYKKIERNIVRDENDFYINGEFLTISKNNKEYDFEIKTNQKNIFITNVKDNNSKFILSYWTSKIASDSFDVKSIIAPKIESYLDPSLDGIQQNTEVTQLICFFDYLRSSNSSNESKLGNTLYELIKKIIKLSLIDGELKYVERQTLTPIISLSGIEISLDKLSSGNLYLVQRFISLLGQMYAYHIFNKTTIEDLCNTPGLLMIDEAENHLHPKWQKTFLNSILEIFPNLQIIVTTHSPFIVSSVKNANIYVCSSRNNYSIVENKTEEYSNKPIEDILLSSVFNTSSFSVEISNLLQERKMAIKNDDLSKAKTIEQELLKINPEYFSYFEIDALLKKITKV